MRQLLLASQSPYRRELLERLRVPYSCHAPKIDEAALQATLHKLDPHAIAIALARAKAESLVPDFPHALIIGSDQLVALDDLVLGKPGSPERAIDQLQLLSGKTHRLITGVALCHDGQTHTFAVAALMTMRALSRDELARYVQADQPDDCAGSYKLEKLGITLFEKVQTDDFTTIMGLPLIALTSALRELGYQVP